MQDVLAVTPSEFARRFGIAVSTVDRWMRSGEVRYITIAGRRRIPASEIDRLLDGPEKAPADA